MPSFAIFEFLGHVRRQYLVPVFMLFLNFRYSFSTNLLTAFMLFSILRYMNSQNPVTAFRLFLLLRYIFLCTLPTCISVRNTKEIQRQITIPTFPISRSSQITHFQHYLLPHSISFELHRIIRQIMPVAYSLLRDCTIPRY